MTLEDKILQTIKAAMPATAEIRVVSRNFSLNVEVSWRLNDDPERLTKMSKAILICVLHEVVTDVANMSDEKQTASCKRISEFLSARLAQFDPQHNASSCEITPAEQWVINSAVVLGLPT